MHRTAILLVLLNATPKNALVLSMVTRIWHIIVTAFLIVTSRGRLEVARKVCTRINPLFVAAVCLLVAVVVSALFARVLSIL